METDFTAYIWDLRTKREDFAKGEGLKVVKSFPLVRCGLMSSFFGHLVRSKEKRE